MTVATTSIKQKLTLTDKRHKQQQSVKPLKMREKRYEKKKQQKKWQIKVK